MALRDPFAAYNAGTNIEAHLVCRMLNEAGIEAAVIEDISAAGIEWVGLLSEIHKPQVWIERADIERAKPILDEYEQRAAERRKTESDGEPIDVTCEECGQTSEYPATQKGSVQSCSHCGAYVDVGDEVPFEGWDEVPPEDETPPESGVSD